MRTTDDAALCVVISPFQAARDTECLQAGRHRLGTGVAPCTQLAQSFDQRRMGRRHLEAHDVHGATMPCHGNLDAIDKLQPQPDRGGTRLFQSVQIVMISQRQHAHPARGGMGYQFGGR